MSSGEAWNAFWNPSITWAASFPMTAGLTIVFWFVFKLLGYIPFVGPVFKILTKIPGLNIFIYSFFAAMVGIPFAIGRYVDSNHKCLGENDDDKNK